MGKYWSTKDVLFEMLSSDDPAVSDSLSKNHVLRQKMKACLVRPFQKRSAITQTHTHTSAKAFGSVINCMSESNF